MNSILSKDTVNELYDKCKAKFEIPDKKMSYLNMLSYYPMTELEDSKVELYSDDIFNLLKQTGLGNHDSWSPYDIGIGNLESLIKVNTSNESWGDEDSCIKLEKLFYHCLYLRGLNSPYGFKNLLALEEMGKQILENREKFKNKLYKDKFGIRIVLMGTDNEATRIKIKENAMLLDLW